MARELEPKVKELSENSNIVYSISKLNSFNTCEYGYHKTYNPPYDRGIDNIYSWAGGTFHNDLEEIYNGKKTEEILVNSLNELLIEADMLNIKFPNDKIRDSWTADMTHFCENFKKPNGKFITEQGMLFNIFDNVWVQGYCDLQELHDEKILSIFDFKTSSKFTKDKLLEAGRQLILYAFAKEQQGYKINKLAWIMLKYVNVCWTLKNGKIKQKMCNRSKWVKEIYNNLEKDLANLGYDDFEISMMIDEAVGNNNLSNLPKEVQDKYNLEDCILEYPYTKELKEELIKYIKSTHEQIINKDCKNEEDWQPVEITEKTNFFCFHLCNHRRNCKYLRMYIDEQDFEKKEIVDEMTELFG